MRAFRPLLCLAFLLLATGCTTYSLEELRTATPKGTPLQAALAVRYLHLAQEQAAGYDWGDSHYFADKGLRAAYGHDVAPEELALWNIPADKRPEMEEARARLLEMLESGAAQAQPEIAAEAQYRFDCWVENQDEGWKADEIAWCRDGFVEAMQSLDGTEPDAAGDDSAYDSATQAYIVFFGLNQGELEGAGERLVDGVVQDLKNHNKQDYTIVVGGHTDRSGSKRYNAHLSKRRADAVRAALIARGIPKILVRAFGFGETDPRVPTPDGTPEAANRRVEIYIGE